MDLEDRDPCELNSHVKVLCFIKYVDIYLLIYQNIKRLTQISRVYDNSKTPPPFSLYSHHSGPHPTLSDTEHVQCTCVYCTSYDQLGGGGQVFKEDRGGRGGAAGRKAGFSNIHGQHI